MVWWVNPWAKHLSLCPGDAEEGERKGDKRNPRIIPTNQAVFAKVPERVTAQSTDEQMSKLYEAKKKGSSFLLKHSSFFAV